MKALRPWLFAVLFAAPAAFANERHFTYTYETAILPPGARELELWTTPRIGREDYYLRFDNRVELELGLTDRLMTALYLNFNTVTAGPARQNSLKGSVSSEWKYKLFDPVADPVGLGLYGEVAYNPAGELELEAKVLLDKKLGPLLLAFNAIGEHELGFEADGLAHESKLEVTLGAAYELRPGLYAGVELRDQAVFGGSAFEAAALFGGPVVSYATEKWFLSATLMPQLFAIKPPSELGAAPLSLDEHERFNARVLMGFHL